MCPPQVLSSFTLTQALISVAFPDDGAAKRFGSKFAAYPIVICHKIRDGDRRVLFRCFDIALWHSLRTHFEQIVTVKEGDVVGRHVVIVDDLVQTGGTLIGAATSLKDAGLDCVVYIWMNPITTPLFFKGALRVSAYVTHGIFPNMSWKKFVDNPLFFR